MDKEENVNKEAENKAADEKLKNIIKKSKRKRKNNIWGSLQVS